jgi:hypothetical protein
MSPTRAFVAAVLALVASEPAAARSPVEAYKKSTYTLKCATSALGKNGFIVVTNTTQQTIPMSATIEIRMKIQGSLAYVEKKFVRVSQQLKTPKGEIAPGEGAWMLYRPGALSCSAHVTLAPRVSR